MNLPSTPQSLPPLPQLDPSKLLRFPNSLNTLLLPTNDCILYSRLTKNYIAWSMLSNLLTSPTNVLKKFEFDKNNSHTVSSNLHWTKDSNVTLGVSLKRYVYENLHHDELTPPQPLHGDPQNPHDPINEILRLYSDM